MPFKFMQKLEQIYVGNFGIIDTTVYLENYNDLISCFDFLSSKSLEALASCSKLIRFYLIKVIKLNFKLFFNLVYTSLY